MTLVNIKEFGVVVMYGYTYNDAIVYWSMRYYAEADKNNLREMRRFGQR